MIKKYWLPILICILLVTVQLKLGTRDIKDPITDGTIHWNFGDAFFLTMSLHSNDKTVKHPMKIFGTAQYIYDDNNEIKDVKFYSAHGFLPSFLLSKYTKVFGYDEWVIRSFSLIVAIATSIVMFWVLFGYLKNAYLAGLLTLFFTLLPLKIMFMNHFKQECIAEFLLLTGWLLLLRPFSFRYWKHAFLTVFFLIFHSYDTAYLPAFLMLGYIYINPEKFGEKKLLKHSAICAVVSIAITANLQMMGGYTPSVMLKQFKFRTVEFITWQGWYDKQLIFFKQHFDWVHVYICISLLAIVAIMPKLIRKNGLIFAGVSFIGSTIAWLLVFRNHSFVHNYANVLNPI